MNCPICGRENPEGSQKCSHCGTHFKTLQQSIAPNKELKPAKKQSPKKSLSPIVSIVSLCLVAAVALILVLAPLLRGNRPSMENPTTTTQTPPPPASSASSSSSTPPPLVVEELETNYIPYETHITHYFDSTGQLCFLFDTHVVETGLTPALVYLTQRSLDGRSYALLTDTNQLLLARDGQVRIIQENVLQFFLSEDGTGIVYEHRPAGTQVLCLYRFDEDVSYSLYLGSKLFSYVISPDGYSIAYTLYEYSSGSTSYTLVYDGTYRPDAEPVKHEQLISYPNLSAVNNDGRCIFFVNFNGVDYMDLYCIQNFQEPKAIATRCAKEYEFNSNHTQVKYRLNNNTYFYDATSGETRMMEKVYNLLLPDHTFTPGSASFRFGTTRPVTSFYENAYVSGAENKQNVILLRSNAELTRQILKDVQYVQVDKDGFLYYRTISDQTTLCSMPMWNEGKMRAFEIPFFSRHYFVSARSGKIFYMTEDGLFVHSGWTDPTSKSLTDYVYPLLYENSELRELIAVDAEGIVYFLEHNVVYTRRALGPGFVTSSIQNNVSSMEATPNGLIYLHCENGDLVIHPDDGEAIILKDYYTSNTIPAADS